MTGRVTEWTSAYLAACVGHHEVPVEYSVRGITQLDPRINFARHMRRTMSFAEGLRAIESTPTRGVKHYLSMLELARWLPELTADVGIPQGVSDDANYLGAYLFVGGDGTGTALHYDPSDNYLFVTQGEKEVWLLPPGQLKELRVAPLWQPHCGVSRLEPGRVDAYLRSRSDSLHCLIRAGEMLYLPQNWWHRVRNHGLTLGVSLSFKWSAASLWRWRQLRLMLRLEIDQWLATHSAPAALVDDWIASLGWRRARRSMRPLTPARRNPRPRERPASSLR
jgi:lysine-specific demethylase 8